MMTGKSIYHVNQGMGTCYSKDGVEGYYNDLTEKVTRDSQDILVPQYYVDTGEKVFFSIGIFQYGLAAYDLFLKTGDEIYKKKLLACASWAIENQQENGGWVAFGYKETESPYSSMAQGEGISMLIRAHIVSREKSYIKAVHKAKDFMLMPIPAGGTTGYIDNGIYLYESVGSPLILNGWIFSLWGLYDYYKFFGDKDVKQIVNKTLESLKKKLGNFDTGYWSNYDEGGCICSPFYHKLHIAQLRVMHDLFDDAIYEDYANKWESYEKNFWKSQYAFIKKAIQKILD